jgi:hypothetical protein
VRVAVKRPGEDPEIRELEDDRGAIASAIGATKIDTRPFTMHPPYLAITFDEDFGRADLVPNVQHPSYSVYFEIRGTVVVTGYDTDTATWRGLRRHEEALALDLLRAFSVELRVPGRGATSKAPHLHLYAPPSHPKDTSE